MKLGETMMFYAVQLATHMWNILNIRSQDVEKDKKYPDREKFIAPNDHRFNLLLQMATMFKEMDNSIRGQRNWGLTGFKNKHYIARSLELWSLFVYCLVRDMITFFLESSRTESRLNLVYAGDLAMGTTQFLRNK